MKILKLTDQEYQEASKAIDKLLDQGIGELIEMPYEPQESRILDPMILKYGGNDYEVVALEKKWHFNPVLCPRISSRKLDPKSTKSPLYQAQEW